MVPAGPLAIRFAAPPGARLVWSPVGRRGEPEYVPASSLSPDHPTARRSSARAGAAPLDGLIALALLLTLVGSAARARAPAARAPCRARRGSRWARCSSSRLRRALDRSRRASARPGTRTSTGRPAATTSPTCSALDFSRRGVALELRAPAGDEATRRHRRAVRRRLRPRARDVGGVDLARLRAARADRRPAVRPARRHARRR